MSALLLSSLVMCLPTFFREMSPLPLFTVEGASSWKEILRKSFTKVVELAEYLELDQDQKNQLILKPKFPIQVPLRIAQKMAKRSLIDPLAIQFLPLKQELEVHSDFVKDPVCDFSFQETEKLLHKYDGRVLLICTGACAMHCRYCFRQNFDYEKAKKFDESIKWIENNSSVHEVILSGGDPLSLSQNVLDDLLMRLGNIPHIKKIRFHSRFPIGIPERIDEPFLRSIEKLSQQVYFVIHCNHIQEMDLDIYDRLRALRKIGCVVFNQSVLLKGVNDSVEALVDLCLGLVDQGIIPYYLHQLDRVQGASHFEVSESEGLRLIDEITKKLPGYAVPKYVREIAGRRNKTVLTSYLKP